MNKTTRLGPLVKLALMLAGLVSTLASCATYKEDPNTSTSLAGGSGGAGGDDVASTGGGGLAQAQGGGGSPATGGAAQAGMNGGGAAGALTGGAGASSGGGGAASAGASGSSGAGGGRGGGAGAGAGAGGNGGGGASAGGGGKGGGGAGSGGTAGTAGAQGNAGTGGSGGAPVLLSQGKTASADSEQTGNLAPAGNDGSLTSRWCAANGAVGHYWKVDLAQSYALTKLHILWEKATLYKFKVEGSTDNQAWVSLLDETNGTSTIADQTYTLPLAPTARWVRITVTNLPDPNTWASFFEFQVYGH